MWLQTYDDRHIHKKGPSQFRNDYKCPFCQQALISTKNSIKATKKLIKKKNPKAYMKMADVYRTGEEGVFQSDTKSLEMFILAAELGDAEAFENLGIYYKDGIAVEQDRSKALAFYEVSAKRGSITGHQELVRFHLRHMNVNESIKHCKVAASAGDQESMDYLMKAYKDKLLTKQELTQMLRTFQTSKNAMKSKDRENALDMITRFDDRHR